MKTRDVYQTEEQRDATERAMRRNEPRREPRRMADRLRREVLEGLRK